MRRTSGVWKRTTCFVLGDVSYAVCPPCHHVRLNFDPSGRNSLRVPNWDLHEVLHILVDVLDENQT
jgi:hypothetical protein